MSPYLVGFYSQASQRFACFNPVYGSSSRAEKTTASVRAGDAPTSLGPRLRVLPSLQLCGHRQPLSRQTYWDNAYPVMFIHNKSWHRRKLRVRDVLNCKSELFIPWTFCKIIVTFSETCLKRQARTRAVHFFYFETCNIAFRYERCSRSPSCGDVMNSNSLHWKINLVWFNYMKWLKVKVCSKLTK